jgi:hypothetical protein
MVGKVQTNIQNINAISGGAVPAPAVAPSKNFGDILKDKLINSLENASKGWSALEGRVQSRLSKLDPINQNLIETQLLAQRISVQTEMMSKFAEGGSSTLKKVQQLGGGN